jgi:hypothetical protein
MSPEIQNALTTFVVAVILSAAAGMAGFGAYLKASFERRDKQKALYDEEARKDREQKRNAEMEQMRRETAKAQADAEEAKAQTIGMTNLTNAILQLTQTHHAEQSATRGEMSNQAQSIGDLEQSVDTMASAVSDNNVITRATGKKADDVVKVVEKLYDLITTKFPTDNKSAAEEAREVLLEVVNQVCEQKITDSQEVVAVVPPPDPPDELPKAG